MSRLQRYIDLPKDPKALGEAVLAVPGNGANPDDLIAGETALRNTHDVHSRA